MSKGAKKMGNTIRQAEAERRTHELVPGIDRRDAHLIAQLARVAGYSPEHGRALGTLDLLARYGGNLQLAKDEAAHNPYQAYGSVALKVAAGIYTSGIHSRITANPKVARISDWSHGLAPEAQAVADSDPDFTQRSRDRRGHPGDTDLFRYAQSALIAALAEHIAEHPTSQPMGEESGQAAGV